MSYPPNTKLKRAWYVLGTVGTILALVILATSLLLRIATQTTLDGHTQSVLSPALEQVSRLLHRLAASGVGVLALIAIVMCFRKASLASGIIQASTLVLVTTASLAVIGPLTPGYHIAAVTVLNVGLGSILLLSFWQLREIALAAPHTPRPLSRIALFTLTALMLHIGTGAAAAASSQWLPSLDLNVWLHLASAVGLMVLIALLMRQHRKSAVVSTIKVFRYLMVGQILLGGLMMVLDERPIWVNFAHGMVSALLALLLLALIHRQ